MIKDFLRRIGRKNIIIFISILLFSAVSTFVVLQKIDANNNQIVEESGVVAGSQTSEPEQSPSDNPDNKTDNAGPNQSTTNQKTENSSSNFENLDTTNQNQNTPNTNSNTGDNPTSTPNNTASPNPTPTNTPQPTSTPTQNDNVQVSFRIYWENNKPVYDYYVTVCLGELDVAWGHFSITDPEGNSWITGNHDFRQKPCQKIGVVSGSLLNKPLGEYTFKAVIDELGVTKTAKAILYPLR